MTEDDRPPKEKAAHDLITSLRGEGYTVGFDSSDTLEDFEKHAKQAQAQLDQDDLAAFFVVAHRDEQTDYSTSVVVDDEMVWALIQIEMLGAHFRTVYERVPLEASELIDVMVDEALAVDEIQHEGLDRDDEQ